MAWLIVSSWSSSFICKILFLRSLNGASIRVSFGVSRCQCYGAPFISYVIGSLVRDWYRRGRQLAAAARLLPVSRDSQQLVAIVAYAHQRHALPILGRGAHALLCGAPLQQTLLPSESRVRTRLACDGTDVRGAFNGAHVLRGLPPFQFFFLWSVLGFPIVLYLSQYILHRSLNTEHLVMVNSNVGQPAAYSEHGLQVLLVHL